MKNFFLLTGTIAIVAGLTFSSCKKTIENHYVSSAYVPPVNGITSTTLGVKGSASPTAYNGTLLANTTYTIVGDIEVEPKDTIFVQPGVKICVEDTSCIVVKGAFVSLGTEANPIIMTDCAVTPNNALSATEGTDPAWNNGNGWWSGIQCDTSCTLLVLKWTQIWFTGAPFHRAEPVTGTKSNGTSYGILFQNTNGNFIMEDCKMYGGIDDAVRVQTGKFDIMRNVFEKMGYQGGDCNNVKSGGVGDCAYNLYIGEATNGSKASNKGGNPVQCNMCMYNNTYINCGYRNGSGGVGSDIDYEQGAEGAAYNNLIVNCRIGFRIVYSPIADTLHLWYGNNFTYGDSLVVTSQFYPNPGNITKLNAYISPIPAETGYIYNNTGSAAYNAADAAALCGENNPKFLNFPLPESGYPLVQVNNYESADGGPGFDFHLVTGSPCIGAGTTSFPSGYPINACASVSIPKLGFTPNESAPCSDIGCYPFTNTAIGNQQ
ncbi:MAG TPA: hypothetical protein VK808_13455 [Bacteroidia bacterium]|nr:hypothetical protein [Bacteroidia bacterium]